MIKLETGGVQVFYGDFYVILQGSMVRYGSARLQWENMHTEFLPGLWVKTKVPLAYSTDRACRIVTLVEDDDGAFREMGYDLAPGDWIVRQPGGEVQHIKPHKYPEAYFSEEEALALGLYQLSAEEFAEWAIAQAHATVRS